MIACIVGAAEEKKAERITSYNISNPNAIMESIVMMSATNVIHCRSLVDDLSAIIDQKTSEWKVTDFYDTVRISGNHTAGWVILDCNSILVHVVTEPIRERYELDAFFEKHGIVYHY
jgi:ribosome-associated protein